MSLLGNRGRFTQDNNNFFENNNSEFSSVISLLGKNPNMLFGIKNENHMNSDIKEKLKNANLSDFENHEYSSHKEYNEKINKTNFYKDEDYSSNINNYYTKNKKTSIKLIAAMFVVEIITIVAINFVGSIYRLTNMTQSIPFNIKNVENTEIAEETIKIMKGYKTAAIFGVDSRTGSVDKGNNADVNLIVNLNLETGDAQLISVYRDLYLSVTDNNTYDKLNAAYRRGGPEQAVKTLNKNFDLNIDSYFAFNWKAVADGIELLGGIDLEITKSEYTYMNAFIHETCIATGIDAKNPAAHYIKKSGMQHLDGVQAVAYGRLRLMDSDFQRVERQKKVIALCLEKAKTLDIPRLRLIVEAVLPQIAYAFDMNEIISLLKIVRNINITDSSGCPDVNNVVTMSMGGSGDCVVPLNLEKAVKKLHNILFNVDEYTPSNAVKRYSNRITELRVKYTEENRINESLKESSKLESIMELTESNSSNKPKPRNKVASSSNTKQTNPIPVSAPNNLNIVDADSNIEEPETDDNKTNINNQSAPTNSINNSNTAIPKSPNSDDIIVYDAPGVPRNNSGNTNNPVSNSPPSSGFEGSNGVVISGPPGSQNPTNNGNASNQNTPNEVSPIVPIITAPY